MGVEETSADWAIRVEINAKGNIATVTAYQKKLLKTVTPINQEQGEDLATKEEYTIDAIRRNETQYKYGSSLG